MRRRSASVHGGEVAALEADGAADDRAVAAEIAHHPEGDGGLAAAAFADEAEGLAGHDPGGEIHHRGDLAGAGEEADREVVDLENRLGHGALR